MWAEATQNRLELRTLDESTGSLEEQAKVARAGYWPRVDGVGDVIYADPNQRVFPAQDVFRTTWDLGIQVSWSPNEAATAGAAGSSLDARASSLAAQRKLSRMRSASRSPSRATPCARRGGHRKQRPRPFGAEES